MKTKHESTNREQDKASVNNIQKWVRSLSSIYNPHPSVKDIGERRRAQLLNIITLILAATFILALLARPAAVSTFIFLLLLSLASFALGKTKYYKAGAALFTLGFLSSAFLPLLMGTAGGFVTSITSIVPIALVVASVLVGQREFLFVALYATLGTFLAPYYSRIPTTDVTRSGGIVLAIGAILYGINAFRASVEHARLKEVQDVNRELAEIQIGLEQRVADRTKALITSSEVTHRLAAVTNPRQLAVDVVDQVQTAFDYYHAHIYYRDEATGDLIMAGGTGEAGAAMLASGHRVPKGRGLVGRAADTNAPVLVSDVTQSAGWLPNPLLLETRSEVAVPISTGAEVLGVLDVQQNRVNGLTEDDVTLLQSIAGQVAISLQNARSFEQSKAQAELETLVNTIGQQIQRTTTVEETLQTAIRGIGMALGAQRVKASIARHISDGNESSNN
jgi:putative methionine-R-sulfoxide reductase with GAF domain